MADEPQFDCRVSWALQRAEYVGTDSTGSDQWDTDVRALTALAEAVRRLQDV